MTTEAHINHAKHNIKTGLKIAGIGAIMFVALVGYVIYSLAQG